MNGIFYIKTIKFSFFFVSALPHENPRIIVLSQLYHYGDSLSATCVSAPADPTPVLTWYINNQEVILFKLTIYGIILIPLSRFCELDFF